jgi:hypothetical protein
MALGGFTLIPTQSYVLYFCLGSFARQLARHKEACIALSLYAQSCRRCWCRGFGCISGIVGQFESKA